MRRLPALAIVLVAASAAADPAVVMDGDRRWTIELPAGFQPDEDALVPEGTLLASFAGAGDRRVAVLRVRANTDGALAGDKTYFIGLEDGVRGAAADYRKLSATAGKIGRSTKVPIYDLWYRDGSSLRGTRFVLLRGTVLILTVDAPRTRRMDKGLKKVLESFQPE